MSAAIGVNEWDGVVFDLDGTLYHMKWYMRPLLFLRLFPHGPWLPAYMKERAVHAGKDYATEYQLLESLSAGLAKRVGAEAPHAFSWICRSFYPAFVASMRLLRGSRPGLDALLEECRKQGKKIAVLSDFGMIRPRLLELGIDPTLVDLLVSSESEGALKPHPRPLLAIAASMQIAPSRLVVVGDRDDTDGEVARACGAHFLRISDRPAAQRPKGSHPWVRIADILSGQTSQGI